MFYAYYIIIQIRDNYYSECFTKQLIVTNIYEVLIFNLITLLLLLLSKSHLKESSLQCVYTAEYLLHSK